MERTRLSELLEQELRHLPVSGEAHFHVVVATDKEDVWENPRFVASPPYKHHALAERDAGDPQLLEKVSRGYQIDVLDCRRACPRSSLGSFGWGGEQADPFHWWDVYRWR